ncbi:DNA mismatch repair protein MLH3 isoform X7 [Rosa chinensis]|uniref:DNA mismatch repair protein MLH3 isoform X7 n=1 Tax=Rosa chinensis TaxID=74649 RepID=UPI001AD90826|nr:DNA mismatch repair protein MLH3 isoform X7 [Rosa chinensis]
MRSLRRLPEAVRSSIRSGVILYDVARVVEELVFNSLDAGARKVSVFVGIGTCYVKVVDDGCGITRDGLVLLGERYATSKFEQFTEADAASVSFGSRGEALASISDVALLEVVTKASGRPNGYRKVMKGFKCLYLGVDDDRKDVGTTVVVRDLFYNQPVRRKCMRSSPKKVLDTVKKCVHRIALVHSMVSFKVVDMESEDELLRTIPSPSPMTLLESAFGSEVSDALHELNISDGKLELSGYISTPCNSLAIKAIQYFYINSRFICKGPIHKLLNQLASSFECWDPGTAAVGSRNRKRSRPQAFPVYVLNLSCPQSFYDLNFEPSKTYAEFKDWGPVLNFIDKAIQSFWKEKISYVESVCHGADIRSEGQMWEERDNTVSVDENLLDVDLSEMSPIRKKRSRIQDLETSPDIMKILSKEGSDVSQRKYIRIPFDYLHENTDDVKGFKDRDSEIDFRHDSDYSFQPQDQNLAKCMVATTLKRENHSWMSDINFSPDEDYMMDSGYSAAKRSSNLEDNMFTSAWQDQPFKLCASVSKVSADTGVSHHDFSSNVEVTCDLRQPFLNSCSSRGRLPSERDLLTESGIKCQNDYFGSKRMQDGSYNTLDFSEIDGSSKRIRSGSYNSVEVPDISSMTSSPGMVSSAQPYARVRSKFDPFAEFDPLSRANLNSIPSCKGRLDEASLDISEEYIGSCNQTLKTEWYSVTSNPLSQSTYLDFEPFSNEDSVEGHYRYKYDKRDTDKYFVDAEEFECSFGSDIVSNIREHCITDIDCGLGYNDNAGSRKFLHQDNIDREFSSGRRGKLAYETDWLSWHSRSKDNICIDMHNRHEEQSKYRDCLKSHVLNRRSIRSHSAPPFPRSKRKYFTLNHPATTAGKHDAQTFHDSATYPEAGTVKDLCQPRNGNHQNLKTTSVEDLLLDTRPDINAGASKMQKLEMFEQSKRSEVQATAPIKEIISMNQDSLNCGTKWRNCCPQIIVSNMFLKSKSKVHGVQDGNDILDISSGFLNLAADSLVPESLHKNCLKHSRVLQQVDKKFIPVMAGQTLAVIDQHAADERIRLEELRHKVLSGDGEAKTVTFLDFEQELVLPEIGYQLLHNYAKTIEEWGWRCNIHAQDSGSFKRYFTCPSWQPTVITLIAVPCILGVNLSDVDLMEFLQQLSDTDGSSTMPPSVLRILNSKACRGAIMFGDSLLPSECCLIVDELKQTSLCFQCAHGRPTTAPLVNLEALHKQIAKIASLNLNNGADQAWHGLHQHELSLARAEQRLNSATS